MTSCLMSATTQEGHWGSS